LRFPVLDGFCAIRQWLIAIAISALTATPAISSPLIDQAGTTKDKADARYIALHQLLDGIKYRSEDDKVELVNLFFNSVIEYKTDEKNWGVADYWSTPSELIEKGAGDCEDFAIAKYYSLLALGVPRNKLRLTYAYLTRSANGKEKIEAHLVLSFFSRTSADPLILDNVNPGVRQLSGRKDLEALLHFDTDGLLNVKTSDVYPIEKYAPWKNFLSRQIEAASFVRVGYEF
jgi:predicted transglutaminase-like cysteine proteinase